jgi:hypothetical protein
MQCVQAARDGAPPQSLFAKQCDLVLELAAHELPDIIVPRASDKNQERASIFSRNYSFGGAHNQMPDRATKQPEQGSRHIA